MSRSDESNRYTVALTNEDGIWLIEAVDLEGVRSFGRTVSDAARNVREAIAAAEDLDEWEKLNLVFTIDDEAASVALKRLRQAKQEEEQASAERDQALQGVIEVLRSSQGMSYRDIGTVIGLSHQRVAQLAPQARV